MNEINNWLHEEWLRDYRQFKRSFIEIRPPETQVYYENINKYGGAVLWCSRDIKEALTDTGQFIMPWLYAVVFLVILLN